MIYVFDGFEIIIEISNNEIDATERSKSENITFTIKQKQKLEKKC